MVLCLGNRFLGKGKKVFHSWRSRLTALRASHSPYNQFFVFLAYTGITPILTTYRTKQQAEERLYFGELLKISYV